MKLYGLMNIILFSCRLGKRALLLQQMEAHYEQQKAKKKQQCLMSQAAKERNAQILKVVCVIAYIYSTMYLYDNVVFQTSCLTDLKLYYSTVKVLFSFNYYIDGMKTWNGYGCNS